MGFDENRPYWSYIKSQNRNLLALQYFVYTIKVRTENKVHLTEKKSFFWKKFQPFILYQQKSYTKNQAPGTILVTFLCFCGPHVYHVKSTRIVGWLRYHCCIPAALYWQFFYICKGDIYTNNVCNPLGLHLFWDIRLYTPIMYATRSVLQYDHIWHVPSSYLPLQCLLHNCFCCCAQIWMWIVPQHYRGRHRNIELLGYENDLRMIGS